MYVYSIDLQINFFKNQNFPRNFIIPDFCVISEYGILL